MIDKVVEWLNEFVVGDYFDDSCGTNIFNYEKFINDFKQVMKGGEE